MKYSTSEDFVTNSYFGGIGSRSAFDLLRSGAMSSLQSCFDHHVVISDHSRMSPDRLYYWLDETMTAQCLVLLFDENGPIHGFFKNPDDAALFRVRWG